MEDAKKKIRRNLVRFLMAWFLLIGVQLLLPQELCTVKADVSMGEFADGAYRYDILEDGTVRIARYTGKEAKVEIPSEIGGKSVSVINDMSFYGNSTLESVVVPNGVKEIRSWAFGDCENLEKVTLPKSLMKLYSYAFAYDEKLASIVLPDKLEEIEHDAFQQTGLTAITIPASVTTIEGWVFEGASSLKTIQVDQKNPSYTSVDGVLYDKDKRTVVAYPGGKKGSYTIPEGVWEIDSGAFDDCENLTNVTLPESLNDIEIYAFSGCSSLQELLIPEAVTWIDPDAFSGGNGCTSLSKIEVAEENPFYSSEGGVLFDKKKTTLYLYPAGKTDEFYQVPGCVEKLNDYAFQGCVSLKEVVLPKHLSDLGEHTFQECVNLTEAEIPEGIDEVKYGVFAGCGFTSYHFPENIRVIEGGVFLGCPNLKEVYLPSGVTTLKGSAFENCPVLEGVYIPSQVTEISGNLFREAPNAAIYGFSGSKAQEYAKENDIAFAEIEKRDYPVLFDAGEGTITSDEKNVSFYMPYGSLPVPERDGYVFEGWYTDAKGGLRITENTTVSKKVSHTLYARWIPAGQCRVTFDANDGKAGGQPKIVSAGSIYGELPVPERDGGYQFIGWYTKADGGERICDTDIVRVNQNQTLYAHWLEDIYSIIFGEKSGQGYGLVDVLTIKRVIAGDRFGAMPSPPSKAGFVFDGWSLSAKVGDERITEDTKLAGALLDSSMKSIYLYARWVGKPISVNFDANGGTTKTESKLVTYSHTYGSLPVPERPGYQFGGWYTEKSGGSLVTGDSIVENGTEHTLYAHWIEGEKYQVSFHANGGTIQAEKLAVVYGGTYGTLPEPVRTGYQFAGWYTASEGGKQIKKDSKVSIRANHTLYAHWSPVSIRVDYDANGGSLSESGKTVTYDDTYGTLPEPTRSGYGFAGWYTKRDGGTQIFSNTKVAQTVAHTLYAHWEIRKTKTPDVKELTYKFANSHDSVRGLGYAYDYVIPEPIYRYMFGDTAFADRVWSLRKNDIWGGSCYGFSATSSLVFLHEEQLSASDFNKDAALLSQVERTDYSKKLELQAFQFIECMQIAQNSYTISENRRWNNIDEIYKEVEAFAATGTDPVIISIRDPYEGGHAVVGYKVQNVSSSESRIYIYDCNHPGSVCYLTLYKDASGHHTGWYYDLGGGTVWGSHKGGKIGWTPYTYVKQAWSERHGTNDRDYMMLTMNAEHASVYDFEGNKIVSVKDGDVITEREDIYPVYNEEIILDSDKTEEEDVSIWLPEDMYTLKKESADGELFETAITNVEQSAQITTAADEIVLSVDDESAINYVEIPEKNKDYEIELTSSLDGTFSDVSFSGKTEGEKLVFSQASGNLVIDEKNRTEGELSVSGISMTVDNTSMNGGELGGSIEDAIEISEVVLNSDSLGLSQGETRKLEAEIYPKAAADEKLNWKSSNPQAVTVDSYGNIKAVGKGKAEIMAFTDTVCAVCEVMVTGNGGSVVTPLPFVDVSFSDWFHPYVEYVYQNNLMKGLDDTHFGPVQNLARAQFAVILHRMNKEPKVAYTAKFPDVGDGIWYTDAILWASSIKVVNGYSDTGRFGPADYINREQMAVMMYRYADYKGYSTGNKADISKFKDASQVTGYAGEAMKWAYGNGIITGKDYETRLDPQGNASRAECATIIMRFVEKFK